MYGVYVMCGSDFPGGTEKTKKKVQTFGYTQYAAAKTHSARRAYAAFYASFMQVHNQDNFETKGCSIKLTPHIFRLARNERPQTSDGHIWTRHSWRFPKCLYFSLFATAEERSHLASAQDATRGLDSD